MAGAIIGYQAIPQEAEEISVSSFILPMRAFAREFGEFFVTHPRRRSAARTLGHTRKEGCPGQGSAAIAAAAIQRCTESGRSRGW